MNSMKLLYEECKGCVALPFCKKLTGASPVNPNQSWCNAKFRLEKALELSNVAKEYRNANLYNYKIDDSNRKIFETVSPIIENIVEEIDGGVNMFFIGKACGTGKTFHAMMVLNHYIYKTCNSDRFDFETPLGMYVEYAELMHDLKQFDFYEDEGTLERFDAVRETPLLILDDIGSGINSRFTKEKLYLILNYRFNNRLSTIVTSNYNFDELRSEDIIGERNVSRLTKNCVYCSFQGEDRRRSRR